MSFSPHAVDPLWKIDISEWIMKKQQLFCDLIVIVYLLIISVVLNLIAMVEIFISREWCKTYVQNMLCCVLKLYSLQCA